MHGQCVVTIHILLVCGQYLLEMNLIRDHHDIYKDPSTCNTITIPPNKESVTNNLKQCESCDSFLSVSPVLINKGLRYFCPDCDPYIYSFPSFSFKFCSNCSSTKSSLWHYHIIRYSSKSRSKFKTIYTCMKCISDYKETPKLKPNNQTKVLPSFKVFLDKVLNNYISFGL